MTCTNILTVQDVYTGDGTDESYPVTICDKTLSTEIAVAIDEGLWRLHKTQARSNDPQTSVPVGQWTGCSNYNVGASACAVTAFGVNGYRADGDYDHDPYVETVQRGLACLFSQLAGPGYRAASRRQPRLERQRHRRDGLRGGPVGERTVPDRHGDGRHRQRRRAWPHGNNRSPEREGPDLLRPDARHGRYACLGAGYQEPLRGRMAV